MYTNFDLVILILFYVFTVGVSKSCYWNAACLHKDFSSKTPYNNVRGDIRDSNVKLNGCKPMSVWAFIRHGQRSPGAVFAKNMLDTIRVRDYVAESYRRGNSSLCTEDVENLLNWEPSEEFKARHSLTRNGYQEVFGIGRRLKEAFSELLSDLEDGSYSIRSAYGYWVEDGVEGFVKGLSNKSLLVEDAIPHYDIMATYGSCPKYVNGVKNNKETYKEIEKYERSPEYTAVGERIQQRTNIQYVLTNTNITSLYDLCRYTYVDKKGSPWCALLSEEDLDAIEYHEDLRHYYRSGYGSPVNQLLGHMPMADLYKTFVNAKANNNRKLTTYFTHATMMDMVYSALGWFKDEVPLTGAHRVPNRKWRSTTIGAFAGNLIAVLNRCNSVNETEEYKVVFYVNEEVASWMCDNGVCAWTEFENKFKDYLNTTTDFCFT